ncbi:uncharacterized protein LOC120280497 [Dioscorea cayenensis subsp. rotundata]|uniref:Uncharacterized protein LOC120280497 n=1 Tax=Dioscorea cayennensis subsp. rotundata TaxID=55577 RepID=A0AB40CV80_DIOCR|nr:uncharacterized protein LOC120280497 [Dioscorea cayenensis subsp. rotundata]
MKKQRNYGGWGVIRERCMGGRGGGIVELEKGKRSFGFTIDEDLELLNKPTMKTTVVDDGDIYDCVDIHKQPAFDHPSLKNHKIQLRPSSYPVGLFDDKSSSTNSTTSTEIGLPDGGCPSGTVPIRRHTKETLMRMKSSLKNMNTPSMHNGTNNELHHQRAIYITRKTLSEFYGASAFIDVYSLPLTKTWQVSSSYIWIINNEDDDQINTIAIGWTVSNESYGDTKTRLTASWTIDNFQETGCRDTSCPGFVQVSRGLPLGIPIKPLSTYGGTQYGLNILVFKDPNTKNWWSFLHNNRIPIGYWPNEIFTNLGAKANKLNFGGIVGYLDSPDKPPMGSGHYPIEANWVICSSLEVRDIVKDIYNIRYVV